MGFDKPLTGAQRVARRRATLRARGLRPKTIWVPDTRTPEFQAKARRSCEWLWERAPEEAQALAFIAAMTDTILDDLDQRAEESKRRAQP